MITITIDVDQEKLPLDSSEIHPLPLRYTTMTFIITTDSLHLLSCFMNVFLMTGFDFVLMIEESKL